MMGGAVGGASAVARSYAAALFALSGFAVFGFAPYGSAAAQTTQTAEQLETAEQATQTAERGDTAAHLLEGKAAYAVWCSPCHAPNPRLAGTLALQTKYEGRVPAALEDRIDLTPEVVKHFIRNGVAWMAPFRPTELRDAQVAAIGAYLSAPIEQRGPYAPLLADEMMELREGESAP